MSPIHDYDENVPRQPPRTNFQWAYRTEGQARFEATGPCPVCGCTFTARWPWGQEPTSKGGFDGRREDPDTTVPWPHFCACRAPHLGRPGGVGTGCGAWLEISVPAEGLPR